MKLGQWISAGGGLSVIVCLAFAGTLTAVNITEEVPVGSLNGVAIMEDLKQPLPHADVVVTARTSVPDDAKPVRYTRTDENGKFSLRTLPAGMYDVGIYGKAHSTSNSIVFVFEGKTQTSTVMVPATGPDLELTCNQHVFTLKETPKVNAHGLAIGKELKLSVFRFKDDVLESVGDVGSVVRSEKRRLDKDAANSRTVRPVASTITKDWQQSITTRDIEGVFMESVDLPKLEEGVYLLKATCGEKESWEWLNVTTIAMVSKTGNKKGLAFVTDIDSGKPLAGAEILQTLSERPRYDDDEDSATKKTPKTLRQSVGKTGQDGTLEFDLIKANEGGRAAMVARLGKSRAFTDFYLDQSSDEKHKVWIQTDRPVYRPGDVVQYKGTIRDIVGLDYNLPSPSKVDILVKNDSDEEVQRTQLSVNDFGTFHGDFKVDAEEDPGGFTIEAKFDGKRTTKYVSIASYRKPDFKITVTPGEPKYVRGDKAKFIVKCESYTGEPIVGAKVSGRLTRAVKYSYSPWDEGDDPTMSDDSYEEGDTYYSGGDFVQEFDLTTNGVGEAVAEFDTNWNEEGVSDMSDASYDLSASVEDAGGRYYDGQGSVDVVRGEYDLNAEFARYVLAPGETTELHITAKRNDEKPISAGLEAVVEYGRLRWVGGKEGFIPEGRRIISLDADGKATISVTPSEATDYRAKVQIKDSKGRTIRAEAYTYVYDGAPTGESASNVPAIQLALDKKSYKPGEHARAVVRTSEPGGYALVTVEDDEVLWSKIVSLQGGSALIEFPDFSKRAPNVKVAVAYVVKKEFYEASKNLTIDLSQRRLNVEVSPDKSELRPGESVNYMVTTTDVNGKPVPTEFSLGVVDEAIYSIREDHDNPLKSFYPRRYSNVSTTHSFPEIYLDGDDKAPTKMEVRKHFEDTAFWAPTMRTDAKGQAKVHVKLPDNLTQWRATVTAFSKRTEIGKNKSIITVRKDLMARFSLPSFLTQGDRQEIAGTLTNATDKAMKVHTELQTSGVDVVAGNAKQTIDVAARTTATLKWTVAAPYANEAKVGLLAYTDDGLQDGLEQKVSVKPLGIDKAEYWAGSLTKTTTFDIDTAGANTAELKVALAPSLGASLVESVEELIQFEYGCVEQTTHRFVPAAFLSKYLKESGSSMPALEEKSRKVAKVGMNRLRQLQHRDGGWGWWESGEASEQMTSVALEGLWNAKRAGIEPPAQMLTDGLKWSKDKLSSALPATTTPWEKEWVLRNRRALAYGLSLFEDSPVIAKALQPETSLDNLYVEDIAKLAIGWHSLAQQRSGAGKAAALRERDKFYKALMSRAEETSTIFGWRERGWYLGNAYGLRAMALINPSSPRIEKAVSYILRQRRGGFWYSTWDTGEIVTALCDWLISRKITMGKSITEVWVNGELKSTVDFSTSVDDLNPLVRIRLEDLKKGKNRVELRPVKGNAYYSVTWKTNVRQEKLDPVETDDIAIKREYFTTEAKRLEDGTLKLVTQKNPVSSAMGGQIFRCRLTVKCKQPVEFLIIEDPIPSNCRIVDNDEPDMSSEWGWWWSRGVFRDDKAAFFVTRVRPGEQVIEYAVRAEGTGVCQALPAVAYRMYQPDVRARTGINIMEVRR